LKEITHNEVKVANRINLL